MSEQIKSLVERHVPASYRGTREVQRAVDGIVRDLDALRGQIAAQVTSAGRAKGASQQEIDNLLYSTGLADRPAPQPAATSTEEEGNGLLERLVEFAKGHGFRG